MKTALLFAMVLMMGLTLRVPKALAEDAPVEAPVVAPPAAAAEPGAGEEAPAGEYEIDYEEEPESSEEPEDTEVVKEAPAKKKGQAATAKRSSGGGGPAVQGTHSKNRFAPLLKSDTKSIYKKNGRALDVDTD